MESHNRYSLLVCENSLKDIKPQLTIAATVDMPILILKCQIYVPPPDARDQLFVAKSRRNARFSVLIDADPGVLSTVYKKKREVKKTKRPGLRFHPPAVSSSVL